MMNKTTKICTGCKVEKELLQFSAHKVGILGVRSRCKECLRLKYHETKPDPEQHYQNNRISWLKTRYNLTLKDYSLMLERQNSKCAICGAYDPGKPRNFCIDHDHKCCPGKICCGRCIRGLICDSCNILLGRAKDNLETLRNAISYLESWEYDN